MPCKAMAKSMSATSPAAIQTSSACRSPKRGTCSNPPDTTLPEWLIERGIGETRFALVEEGRIVEARVLREGIVQAGTVLKAQLAAVGRFAIAWAENQEYLLP